MSIIINSFGFDPSPVSSTSARSTSAPSVIASRISAEDTVEFSAGARVLARGVEQSSFRAARSQAIRAEIASGAFETEARLDGTIARLLDVLA